jgi:GTP-binding protein HflX
MSSTVEEGKPQKALLLALEGPGDEWRESLEELSRLAETAGAEVVGTVTQKRNAPDRVHFVGKGKAHEIRQIRGDTGAEMILVDGDLSPSQERNLEDAAGADVLDRTGLILDIFARRARSREGKVQVELAQLSYLLPRLTGKGKELSRLGGGIGTRGPGETKLEADRARIRKRISLLRKQVERIGKRREIERRHREAAGAPVVALVGYTNAGKSTLLNALSGADVFVENLLFATLDPTIRRVELDGGREFLVVDTVGFIRNLPHQLVAAFRATLEEVVQSDVLVHVVDASHPQMAEQITAARRVLAELECADKPTVMAFNKCDAVEDRARLAERVMRERNGVAISALTGEGLDALLRLIGERLEQALVPVELIVPWAAQDLLSEAHDRGRVLAEEFGENGVALTARVPADVAQRLQRAAGTAEPGAEEE